MDRNAAIECLKAGRVKEWNEWRSPGKPWTPLPDLSRAGLSGAQLPGAFLSFADLSEARVSGADLSGADLSRAVLSNADLSGADLSRSLLRYANLSVANLSGADLSNAYLHFADLSGADLSGAKLSGADFSFADLSRTEFTNADLSGTHLFGANLAKAQVSGASFQRAHFGSTLLADVDLSGTTGLELVEHRGPSTVGIDALFRSGGKIPKQFLLGCGVPQAMVDYLPSIVGSNAAIEFYSCFISYSHKDEEFARRLHSRLRDNGLRVWYAPEDIQGGRKLHEQIYEAILVHDKLLLVLSTYSMNSEWVATEIRRARARELKEKRRVLFPIRLCTFGEIRQWELFDADTGKDLAVEVREYFVPDFSDWKNYDSFEKAVGQLLRDLRN